MRVSIYACRNAKTMRSRAPSCVSWQRQHGARSASRTVECAAPWILISFLFQASALVQHRHALPHKFVHCALALNACTGTGAHGDTRRANVALTRTCGMPLPLEHSGTRTELYCHSTPACSLCPRNPLYHTGIAPPGVHLPFFGRQFPIRLKVAIRVRFARPSWSRLSPGVYLSRP